MNNSNHHQEIVDKILNSHTFKDRDLYQKLLTYLYQSYLAGVIPKEITIAQDIFEKGSDFNAAEDTTVRVHMHNLRNKLEQYYQEEGSRDDIRLTIPKGHYKIEFEAETGLKFSDMLKKTNYFQTVTLILLGISLLYILLDTFLLFNDNPNPELIDSDNRIWKQFFNNDHTNSIVIGDFLVFHEYDTGLNRARRIQDYQINTLEELNAYIKENPGKEIDTWMLGELPHNIIFNLIDLQDVFLAFRQSFDISFTSDIDINFIKNRNIIYIGEFKNLRSLANLTSNLPIKHHTLPWWQGNISFQKNDSLITLNTFRDWGVSRYIVDLGLIAKLPGSNRENYLIVAGFGYDAQIKLVKMLCLNESLGEIENNIQANYGNFPEYFVMIFEIRGFDRASTTAEMKFFQEIEQDYYTKQY